MKVILFLAMIDSATGIDMQVTRTVPDPQNAFGLCRHWMETGANELFTEFKNMDTITKKSCELVEE